MQGLLTRPEGDATFELDGFEVLTARPTFGAPAALRCDDDDDIRPAALRCDDDDDIRFASVQFPVTGFASCEIDDGDGLLARPRRGIELRRAAGIGNSYDPAQGTSTPKCATADFDNGGGDDTVTDRTRRAMRMAGCGTEESELEKAAV